MQPKEPSRRAFLGLFSAAAFGTAIPPLAEFAFGEPRAHAAFIKEGMPWQDGFDACRYAVFNNNKGEEDAWYTDRWRFPHNMGALGGSALDGKKFDAHFDAAATQIISERPAETTRAHIHPVATFVQQNLLAADYKEKLARKEVPAALGPPSFQDVVSHIWMVKRFFGPAHIAFKDLVFDPAGVWRMTLREGAFSKMMFNYQLLMKERLPAFFRRLHISGEQQGLLTGAIMKLDEAAIRTVQDPEITNLFADYKKFQEEWRIRGVSMKMYEGKVEEIYEMSTRVSPEERQTMIAEVKALAKEVDIDLSLEPYAKPYSG